MNRVRLSLRLRAARHEVYCWECRVCWRSWLLRLLGKQPFSEVVSRVRGALPDRCENYTTGDCQSAGRDLYSPYGADGYCTRCRVVAALDGWAP